MIILEISGLGTNKGSALIITLFFLCLISLLALGFLSRAMIEVSSAHSHLMGVEAAFYADEGPHIVLNRLQSAMGTNSGSYLTNVSYWITQPGQITQISKAGVTNSFDLTSGAATLTNSVDAVDINAPSIEGFAPWLVNSDTTIGTHMYIDWIYVRKNGLLDLTLPPVQQANDPNPIVGRFAFWTDDQSSRININTAWVRGTENPGNPNYSTYPPSQGISEPSFVNLMGIPFTPSLANSDVDAINSYRDATNHFNSVQDAAAVGNATFSEILTNQNFSLTQYNHSPNLNMFNQPKIMLTTQASNLPGGAATPGVTNFLDILATPNTDPGPVANLSTTKVSNIVNYLMQDMTNSAWPILPGQGFQNKYSVSQAALIAMNIVDYVRSAESTNALVVPLRGSLTSATGTFSYSPTSGNLLSGGRRPYLSKVMFLSEGASPNRTISVGVEIFLPLPPSGGNNTDISANLSQIGVWDTLPSGPGNNGPGLYNMTNIVVPTGNPPNILYGGQYATTYYPATNADFNAARSISLAFFPTNSAYPTLASGNPKYDFSPNTASLFFNHPLGTTNVMAVIDPAVNKSTNDYATVVAANASATAAIPSSGTLSSLPNASIVPQQDTDANGNLNVGWRAPAPKGTASNPYGRVNSVGELGFICTGMDAGNNISGAFSDSQFLGAPWRSLRLQPQSQHNVLPDWILMDLFCVPMPVANTKDQPFIAPLTQNSIGGQINPNPIVPYETSVARQAPLMALLYGGSPGNATLLSSSSTPSVATLAENIFNHTLASSGQSYGYPNQYISPGEISEIQGIADGGESSEALVREIIGQVTVRGNVFSVFSVGQALQEDRQGGLHVLGEARFQTMYERVEPPYSATPSIPTQYLPVYSRRLE